MTGTLRHTAYITKADSVNIRLQKRETLMGPFPLSNTSHSGHELVAFGWDIYPYSNQS